jgi:hypothetical protein
MGSNISSFQSGGARSTAEIEAELKTEKDEAKIAELVEALKENMTALFTSKSSAPPEKISEIEAEIAKIQELLKTHEKANANSGENSEKNAASDETVAENNNRGLNNDGDEEKELTREDCEQFVEKPLVETAQAKTEKEIPGFSLGNLFGFFGNWKSIFETSEWQPTEEEVKKDKCKEILASAPSNSPDESEEVVRMPNAEGKKDSATLPSSLPSRNIPSNISSNPEGKTDSATLPSSLPSRNIPSNISSNPEGKTDADTPPVQSAGGARRKTHKNRSSRRKTRKVGELIDTSV